MLGIVAAAAAVGCGTVYWRLSPRQREAKMERQLHPHRVRTD